MFSNTWEIRNAEECFSRLWSYLAHVGLPVTPTGKHGSTTQRWWNAEAKHRHPDPSAFGQSAAWPTSVFLGMLQSKLRSYAYLPPAIYLPQTFQLTFADEFFFSKLWWSCLHSKYNRKLFSLQFCFKFELWGRKYIQYLNAVFLISSLPQSSAKIKININWSMVELGVFFCYFGGFFPSKIPKNVTETAINVNTQMLFSRLTC